MQAMIENPIAVNPQALASSDIPLLNESVSERVMASASFRQFAPFAEYRQASRAPETRTFNCDAGGSVIRASEAA